MHAERGIFVGGPQTLSQQQRYLELPGQGVRRCGDGRFWLLLPPACLACSLRCMHSDAYSCAKRATPLRHWAVLRAAATADCRSAP